MFLFKRSFSRGLLLGCAISGASLMWLISGGCPDDESDIETEISGDRFANSTDKSNGGAVHVGSSACRQCHAAFAALHEQHGHAAAMSTIVGGPPQFATEQVTDGVPQPPAGLAWSDISYVLGGYAKGAQFVDLSGELITDLATGGPTLWRLPAAAAGVDAGFSGLGDGRRAVEYSDFAIRTTNPQPLDPNNPRSQDNRPGIRGTWSEAGVQCEACHGPGGKHFTSLGTEVQIDRTRIFVDPDGAQSCALCHSQPTGAPATTILAADGFILGGQQWAELGASGVHATFSCTICHDPHQSTQSPSTAGVRNECTACHSSQTMAGHGGAVFQQGDYSETLSCVSCHMPLASRSVSSAVMDVTGPNARVGDTRTHIFRINITDIAIDAMFTADGSHVAVDTDGRASVTVGFTCLRCHNGNGQFELTPARAAEIGGRIHELP